MVGYSRLMEADESGTVTRLKAHRSDLIDPVIAENSGRIIMTTGDGMLVGFAGVVDAVTCAAEIQRRMARPTWRKTGASTYASASISAT